MGFCRNCGGEQEPGAKFCTNCGAKTSNGESMGGGAAVQTAPEVTPAPTAAAVGTAAIGEPQPGVAMTPPVIEPRTSYPESPYYPDSVKPQTSSSTKVVAVVGVMLLAAVAMYYFLAPAGRKGPAPIIDGRQASAAVAEQTFGLEKYPGARAVSASSSDTEQVVAAFETNDSPEQVIGYYRVRFPVAQVTADPTHSTLVAEMNGRQVLVSADALIRGSRVRISYTKPGLAQ